MSVRKKERERERDRERPFSAFTLSVEEWGTLCAVSEARVSQGAREGDPSGREP